jgi:D-glycero-D-manno-heptose 1,7-bisphosphate phosphatase
VRLIDGAAEALALLAEHGYARIVVTNQSAIARGLLDPCGLEAIHDEMRRQLRDAKSGVDAIYFSPRMPLTDDRVTVDYFDRKPGPGMLIRAALEHEIAIGQSWMVGDSISDVEAGRHAGCRGSILIQNGADVEHSVGGLPKVHVVASLLEAAHFIVAGG